MSSAAPAPDLTPDSSSLADAAHHWKSAYVHIPFCARRCPYCDFAIVDESIEDPDHSRYVEAVRTEIAMEESFGPLDAINFGGGTPSRLSATQLGSIVDRLAATFGANADAEISLEVNPEDWSDDYGAALMDAGFNRISIGAQSMDNQILGVLGRLHTSDSVTAAVVGARRAGFRTVSADVIIGHPDESVDSWLHTVEAMAALPVDHMSTYGLTVEPGTALSREVADGAPAPDDDIQAERWEQLDAAARDSGLIRYEVSNLAMPGHACRYNLSTWSHGEYVAFGLGAHDHRWGRRSRNHRRLDRYLHDVESGVRPRIGSESLNRFEQERDRFMLGLRLAAGAPRSTFAEAFLLSDAGKRLVDAGIVDDSGPRVRASQLLLADAVAREALSVPMVDC